MEMDIERELERHPSKRQPPTHIKKPMDNRPKGYFAERISLANRTCWVMGFLLFALGATGFAMTNQTVNTFLGFRLDYLHNLMNTFAGVVTFIVGFSKKGPIAKKYCLWIGSFYFLLAAVGFIFGQHEIVAGMVRTRYLLTLIPEHLSFGRWDHFLHGGIGMIFILAGLLSKPRKSAT